MSGEKWCGGGGATDTKPAWCEAWYGGGVIEMKAILTEDHLKDDIVMAPMKVAD